MNKICACARLYHALVILAGIEIIWREKLVNGEAYAAEHRARIILGRTYALLLRQTVIVSRDEQLCAALKPDDRKLAERNIDMARTAGNGYLFAEGVEYLLRNISLIYTGVWQCRFRKCHVQRNRIDGIDLGKWHAVCSAENAAVIRGKALYSALGAEEHYALIEHGKTREALICRECFAAYLIKVGYIDRVVASVKADLVYLYLAVQKLRTLWTHAERTLYVGKRACRGVNAQILDAVLVAAGVHYLSCAYANGLFYAVTIIDRTGYDPVCHKNTSQDGIEEKLQYSLCVLFQNVKNIGFTKRKVCIIIYSAEEAK